MNVRAAATSVLVLACACGAAAPETGTATINGSIGGRAFVGRDAVSMALSDGYGDSEGVVVMSDVTDLCERAQRGAGLRNAHVLVLTLASIGDANQGLAPHAPGSFRRQPPSIYSLYAFATDDHCELVPGSELFPAPLALLASNDGHVELQSASNDAYTGTLVVPLFDADDVSQGVMKGSFQAGHCLEAAELLALPPARTISSCE